MSRFAIAVASLFTLVATTATAQVLDRTVPEEVRGSVYDQPATETTVPPIVGSIFSEKAEREGKATAPTPRFRHCKGLNEETGEWVDVDCPRVCCPCVTIFPPFPPGMSLYRQAEPPIKYHGSTRVRIGEVYIDGKAKPEK